MNKNMFEKMMHCLNAFSARAVGRHWCFLRRCTGIDMILNTPKSKPVRLPCVWACVHVNVVLCLMPWQNRHTYIWDFVYGLCVHAAWAISSIRMNYPTYYIHALVMHTFADVGRVDRFDKIPFTLCAVKTGCCILC